VVEKRLRITFLNCKSLLISYFQKMSNIECTEVNLVILFDKRVR